MISLFILYLLSYHAVSVFSEPILSEVLGGIGDLTGNLPVVDKLPLVSDLQGVTDGLTGVTSLVTAVAGFLKGSGTLLRIVTLVLWLLSAKIPAVNNLVDIVELVLKGVVTGTANNDLLTDLTGTVRDIIFILFEGLTGKKPLEESIQNLLSLTQNDDISVNQVLGQLSDEIKSGPIRPPNYCGLFN